MHEPLLIASCDCSSFRVSGSPVWAEFTQEVEASLLACFFEALDVRDVDVDVARPKRLSSLDLGSVHENATIEESSQHFYDRYQT